MARENVTTYFKKLLLEFITEPDPLYSMMQWLTEQLMRIESESKVGAEKNKHSKTRRTRSMKQIPASIDSSSVDLNASTS